MKINNLRDVEAFKEAIAQCGGDVWLESKYGDKYNLKSALSQYVAMADLLRDILQNCGSLADFEAVKCRE